MHRAVAAVVATGRAAGGVASARAWCARAGLSTSSAAASTVTVGTPAGGPKLSTGIVGLDVVPNAKEVLIKLYEKTLNDLNIIPAGVPYRTEVEKFTAYRLAAVRAHDDVAAIEAAIGAGQVEELIEEAKGELILIPEYAAWKAWERKRPTPDDDDYADFYDELEVVDPESVGTWLLACCWRRGVVALTLLRVAVLLL